uniref:Late blight resistance protein homolog R1A-3 n=1 Tax=Nicotiana tabacum TaxID=4097 RepID=A0A1S3X5Y3_TOBAC|nr:PREDICTED: putative late blight resistance protein homolog R1A-3 [Nicotiana tabacum]
MESIVIYSFPAELVYLRYFAAQIAQESITSSMTNLWNLQTLIIKPKEGKLTLPITVWKMVKLRHIHIDNAYFSLNDGKELLENLETLSSPSFSCPKGVELLLRKTPNLRELACSFVDFKDDLFPKLDFPAQLETLEIHLATGSMIDGPCNFPSSLRNLTMSRFSLGSCHESNIANLPQLQVLRLVDIVFDNKEWKVRDDEFPELIDLKVEDCVFFEEWNVSDDALPRLHHLVLRKCQYLKVIPDCFQEISSLKSIEIKWCNKSVEKSGIDILRTKVEDYQISDFRVFIN